jgi:hypothetical protein
LGARLISVYTEFDSLGLNQVYYNLKFPKISVILYIEKEERG